MTEAFKNAHKIGRKNSLHVGKDSILWRQGLDDDASEKAAGICRSHAAVFHDVRNAGFRKRGVGFGGGVGRTIGGDGCHAGP